LINETILKHEETTFCQLEIFLFISKSHTKYVGSSQFDHHWYKPTWLAAISSRCLAALLANMSVFNSSALTNSTPKIPRTVLKSP